MRPLGERKKISARIKAKSPIQRLSTLYATNRYNPARPHDESGLFGSLLVNTPTSEHAGYFF